MSDVQCSDERLGAEDEHGSHEDGNQCADGGVSVAHHLGDEPDGTEADHNQRRDEEVVVGAQVQERVALQRTEDEGFDPQHHDRCGDGGLADSFEHNDSGDQERHGNNGGHREPGCDRDRGASGLAEHLGRRPSQVVRGPELPKVGGHVRQDDEDEVGDEDHRRDAADRCDVRDPSW